MNRPTRGRTCTHPTCQAEPVLQWQRRGTDTEARAHSDALIAQQIQLVDYRRAMLTLEIEDLRTKHERLVETGGINPRVLTAVAAQADERQAELDAIEDPVRPLTPEPVTVAVFGCAEHAVDAEAATLLHEPDCLTDGPCGCAT